MAAIPICHRDSLAALTELLLRAPLPAEQVRFKLPIHLLAIIDEFRVAYRLRSL